MIQHLLVPHAPLSDKRLRDSYQFNPESYPEGSKVLVEKLGSQPAVSLNEVVQHISQLYAMPNSQNEPMQVTFTRLADKQTAGGAGGNNDWCCYTWGAVGHPARTCWIPEQVLAAWKDNNLAANKCTQMNQKKTEERHRGSCGGGKKGGYRGGGGATQHSVHFAQTSGVENDHAKLPKVEELSDRASDDSDDSDDSGSGNGDASY